MENSTIDITDKIQELEARKQSALKPYQEIQEDRMRRYFDCQDDTILGGISDQVTSETMSNINRKFDLLIQQVKNGGRLSSSTEYLCLYDLNDNFITDVVVDGRYGKCFLIGSGDDVKFISIAKRQSTYNKKGYKSIIRKRNFSYTFNGAETKSGKYIFKDIILENETLTEGIIESPYNKNWVEYLFNNK
jgi:hypothetical protein